MEVFFLPTFLVAQAIEALQPTRVGADLWLNYGAGGWEVFGNAWERDCDCSLCSGKTRGTVAMALATGEVPVCLIKKYPWLRDMRHYEDIPL